MEENKTVKYEISFDMESFKSFQNLLQEKNLYQIEDLIGQGYFGKIFRAINLQTKQMVALKIVEDDKTKLVQRIIENEKKTFELVNGVDSIVRCYNILQLQNNQIEYIIFELELCQYDLLYLIKQQKKLNQKFTEDYICQMVISILDGLTHLHSKNLIHCDLKPSNMLIKNKNVKLTDFGMVVLNQNQYSDIYCGQPTFCSPEKSSYFSFESDLFSLGIIILMLQNPIEFDYESNSQLDSCWLQLRKGIIPELAGFDRTSFFFQLSQQMISVDPQQRGTTKGIMKKVLEYQKSLKNDENKNQTTLRLTEDNNINKNLSIDQFSLDCVNNIQQKGETFESEQIHIKINMKTKMDLQEIIKQHLDLKLNQFNINLYNQDNTDEFLQQLIQISEDYSFLKEFEFYNEGNTTFSDESLNNFFESIKKLSNLEKLCIFLPQNLKISSNTLQTLNKSIECCKNLKILKLDFLYNTNADDAYLQNLGNSISKLTCLEYIYISFTANFNFSKYCLKQFQNSISIHENRLRRFVFSHQITWVYAIQELV